MTQVNASVGHLSDFFGGFRVKEISTGKINEYTLQCLEEEFKPATINRQISALK